MTLPTPRILASISLALCAALTALFWMIYLLVGNPPGVTAADQLAKAFAQDGGASSSLRWLALLLITSTCLALVYASRLSRSKQGARVLLVVAAAQALAAVMTVAMPESLIFAIPLVWAFASCTD